MSEPGPPSCSTGTRRCSQPGLAMCRRCHGLRTQPLPAETGRWTHSLTCSFLSPITSAIAAFGDFRTTCSRWYPWRRFPKLLPSPWCLLLGPFSPSNKTGAKPGCFLKEAGPAAELSAQPRMLHPNTRGKHVFSTHWGHQLMFVQLQKTLPLAAIWSRGRRVRRC